jgi:hypothetical protein
MACSTLHKPHIQQCVFGKGGTKQWRLLHCLAINSTWTNKQKMNCFLEQNYSNANVNEKVVFLRDPLDRFLSGFLDKSMIKTNEGHCNPNSVFNENETGLVNDFLKDQHKLFKIYVDTFPLTWSLHFFPQSLYCNGLYRNLANYSFIGNMGNDFYRDLGRFTSQYPSLKPLVGNIFHPEGKGYSSKNEGVETKAASHTLEFYTPCTVQRVLEYTAIDYLMLDLPVPSWAESMLASTKYKIISNVMASV